MKVRRKLIQIDEELCNGCGECVPGCEEGALQIVDGKAKLVAEKFCDGLGACLGECPTGALKVIEVEADDFDPDAVTELLTEQGRAVPDHMPSPESLRLDAEPKAHSGCGCGGSKLEEFKPSPCQKSNVPADIDSKVGPSQLTHWPIQIRLVPAEAPFLKDADLLLTADCVAVSLPGYHERFLPGRKVLMGCPKFDDVELYHQRLTEIFAKSGVKSVTVLEMEVPCCANFSRIVLAALKAADSDIPTEKVVVARTGEIKFRGSLDKLVPLK
ncbi:ATP-binding protein [Maridesulfovibrio hydrothermalis]|uniref:4Fe-4S ferredoxin iron-sulfur binding domain protein n=1 Tax=Maridesulfovibrio hydrothermalis AM13 = DSM 14728 TaxID=1121451 RepID=L0R7F8_9BACT|nr:4Fe-4S binding protein [Maridesulfovibrio hydrothermalis]CCO22152.1 4Fe-4S ferredoxin iron-sulfur binding domain protein [Maridesulfovibrio hydrothermalis AM13 = DSM 14728]